MLSRYSSVDFCWFSLETMLKILFGIVFFISVEIVLDKTCKHSCLENGKILTENDHSSMIDKAK